MNFGGGVVQFTLVLFLLLGWPLSDLLYPLLVGLTGLFGMDVRIGA